MKAKIKEISTIMWSQINMDWIIEKNKEYKHLCNALNLLGEAESELNKISDSSIEDNTRDKLEEAQDELWDQAYKLLESVNEKLYLAKMVTLRDMRKQLFRHTS